MKCGMDLGRARIWSFKILYLGCFLMLAELTFGVVIADFCEHKHSWLRCEAESCLQGKRLMSGERPLVLIPQTASTIAS